MNVVIDLVICQVTDIPCWRVINAFPVTHNTTNYFKSLFCACVRKFSTKKLEFLENQTDVTLKSFFWFNFGLRLQVDLHSVHRHHLVRIY